MKLIILVTIQLIQWAPDLDRTGVGGVISLGKSPDAKEPLEKSPDSPDSEKLCDLSSHFSEIEENSDYGITVTHQKFAADELVPEMIYQVAVRRSTHSKHFILASISSNGNPIGRFRPIKGFRSDCGANVLFVKNREEIKADWSYHQDEEATNVTFRVEYVVDEESRLRRTGRTFPLLQECRLRLKLDSSPVSNEDVLPLSECRISFPSQEDGRGLVVTVTRLNVPCARGSLSFSTVEHDHLQEKNYGRLCGKLEELLDADRSLYFSSSARTYAQMTFEGAPAFTIIYRLVDRCYNVTMTSRNGTFGLEPTEGGIECTFKIFLPYGNRVRLEMTIGGDGEGGENEGVTFFRDGIERCDGLLIKLQDGVSTWYHCASSGAVTRRADVATRSNRVQLRVTSISGNENRRSLSLRVSYRAEPIAQLVGSCDFGWVASTRFCIRAVNEKSSFAHAEAECVRRGGHLASVRSERDQALLDRMLINSPGYHDHNAYWIGASDRIREGEFRWSDGLPFSYANWFPGWSQHSFYNRQPNDDGLSEQDCVEVRRVYSLPASTSAQLSDGFTWNDRDCSTLNYFICERLQNDEHLEEGWPSDCNRSIQLSRDETRASVSSPGFPRQYPDNAICDTDIIATAGYRIVLDFEELVLEDEPSCSYDYIVIIENTTTYESNSSTPPRRLCGDWSSKLKLLRYVSEGSRLKIRFSSDYSHHFGGFKARVSMENAVQCADDRFSIFNDSCYLIVSYPEVAWNTSQYICQSMKATLASISSPEEERFITTSIRRAPEYRTSALYWLGAKAGRLSHFKWIDGSPMVYSGWLPNTPNDRLRNSEAEKCLSIQWTASPAPSIPSGLYWRVQKCGAKGGYICKRRHQPPTGALNYNKTINDSEGNFTSPNYPNQYYPNLDFTVRIVGPEKTRIVVKFHLIDIEYQPECLYDYIELKSPGRFLDAVKLCGSHEKNMSRFDFVSGTNEAFLTFHSDYSISGSGYFFTWQAVDVSSCPFQTLTANEGVITSPHYPNFLLSHLDCTVTILAPSGKRIWLEFAPGDQKLEDYTLELKLGKDSNTIKPFQVNNLLTEGNFVSSEERLSLRLKTGDRPIGAGFKVKYKMISNSISEERIISLSNSSEGSLLHVNYPQSPPSNVQFTQRFIAPLGNIILLELHRLKLNDKCTQDSIIEVYDNYADANGTIWNLCYSSVSTTPIYISSFLNVLVIRQKNGKVGVPLNGTLRVQRDDSLKSKLVKYKERTVMSCEPNPCLNGGKCLKLICQCTAHYTGLFCALTKCDLDPCTFGTCHLTESGYKCHCKEGYVGLTCDQKRRPCEGNPCENRGNCIEKNDNFQCQCHAWWEGPRCEKRMTHIPYKPLSERMLHEPFWLGLMTVFVVMGVIGLVWCAKRHFPEKIEKLLAEEDGRNRSAVSSLRSSSVREQLAAASAAAAAAAASSAGSASTTATPSPGPGSNPPARSLFGRLGIRKPSLLSLTSPHAVGGGGGGGGIGYQRPPTGRTFSLDDLLKPPPRRTPSPKKKRNNSTPTKKNAAEKKQILQQLITPVNKASLGELIQLSDIKIEKEPKQEQDERIRETKLGDGLDSAISDPKLEKKVTFARLLSKVSAEMSSGSDMELGIMQTNKLSCMLTKASSTPPSPNSTSSNQGSDSFTSSDIILSSSVSDLLIDRRSRQGLGLPIGKPKPASADSILAMFKNFSSGISLASKVSPSTSPQDEESSTSSLYSIGVPESPIMQKCQNIEVQVLDPMKSSSGNFLHPPTILLEIPSTINKCLSPIRELPTPLPSPALTPVMRRGLLSTMNMGTAITDHDGDVNDEKISIEIPNLSISSDGDEDNISIDPQGEDGLIMEEAATMQNSALFKNKHRPPLLSSEKINKSNNITITVDPPPPLVIPTLTIQTPSPTHCSSKLLPGSPPPHRSEFRQFHEIHQENMQKQCRKMLKDFDKPMSLDLPMITITCNMSEVESDNDNTNKAAGSVGMTYLSPFSINAREHTASESNLSSSGYSSMASPGPSRCSSNNPLCIEVEDQQTHRRQSLQAIPTNPSNPVSGDPNPSGTGEMPNQDRRKRGRSDSETLSEIESNDEGIGTDHLDEKIDDGELKSAKELEVFMESCKNFLDQPPATHSDKNSLQLPSIVVQSEHLSPVSSRSESPLSDKMSGMERFSAQFYGKNKDLLPFTDSDGLYDFPSSDRVNITTSKKPGKKREKKQYLRSCKGKDACLDVPNKEYKSRKSSPKRLRSQVFSSSSSSDSVTSIRDWKQASSNPNLDTIRIRCSNSMEGPNEDPKKIHNFNTSSLPSQPSEGHKISKLRAISHQIRFLKRLEQSLKRREQPLESSEDSAEECLATSPLLQTTKETKVEIKKCNSIGKLHQHQKIKTAAFPGYRRDFLLRQKQQQFKIVGGGNGYSD